jgi:hypothetical protein
MSLLAPLAPLLGPINSTLRYLHTTPLHDVYFPYPLFMVLHAIRISIPFQMLTRRSQAAGVNVSKTQELGGYLLMVSSSQKKHPDRRSSHLLLKVLGRDRSQLFSFSTSSSTSLFFRSMDLLLDCPSFANITFSSLITNYRRRDHPALRRTSSVWSSRWSSSNG